jgi:Fe-S-cluster containining protein
MDEKRFQCTACGLCCNGIVPLTIDEAIRNASLFPLAVTITPMKPGVRGAKVLDKIGIKLDLPGRRKVVVSVMPVAFIPKTHPCPALAPDGLCSIHDMKPLRCRAMPFYAYKDEDSQADMLVPRKGWLCETGPAAPVVYRERKIVDRTDFAAEREALVAQTPILSRFVKMLVQFDPAQAARLLKASQTPVPGRLVVSFFSLLKLTGARGLLEFADRQGLVLQDWLDRTSDDPTLAEFSGFYRSALSELPGR